MSSVKVVKEVVKLSDAQLAEIETAIKAGTFKLSLQAKALSLSAGELRKQLVNRFGTNLVFKRGRTGGIFWNQA